MRVEIVVPGVPSSLNAWTRAHWQARNRERKLWAEKVLLTWLSRPAPRPTPFVEPVSVTLLYRVTRTGKRGKPIDLDNMAPKHLIDALRGVVIVDDGPQWVRQLVQRISVGGERDETVIRVEPLSEAL